MIHEKYFELQKDYEALVTRPNRKSDFYNGIRLPEEYHTR